MSNSQSFTSERILSLLTETPRRIDALTAGLAAAQLQAAPGQEAWSANEVLAHLRACADVWGKCMLTIIAQDRPTLVAVSPRTWIRKTDYLAQEFSPSLRAFAAQRDELLAVLEPLAPAGWSRTATVTGAGKVLERTLLDYARRMVEHEKTHLRQVEGIVDARRRSGGV